MSLDVQLSDFVTLRDLGLTFSEHMQKIGIKWRLGTSPFFYAERSTAMRLPTNDKTVDCLGNFEYRVVGVLPDWASCPVLPHGPHHGHWSHCICLCMHSVQGVQSNISISTQNISSQWSAPSFGMAVTERSPAFRPYRHRRRIRFAHRYMLWEGQKDSLAHTIWLWGGQMPILPSPGSATEQADMGPENQCGIPGACVSSRRPSYFVRSTKVVGSSESELCGALRG